MLCYFFTSIAKFLPYSNFFFGVIDWWSIYKFCFRGLNISSICVFDSGRICYSLSLSFQSAIDISLSNIGSSQQKLEKTSPAPVLSILLRLSPLGNLKLESLRGDFNIKKNLYVFVSFVISESFRMLLLLRLNYLTDPWELLLLS